MPEIKVTILGTEKLLKNLDPTKATGPDQTASMPFCFLFVVYV
jgi:hypothetical protein